MFCRAYGGYLVRCCGGTSASATTTHSQAQGQGQGQAVSTSTGGDGGSGSGSASASAMVIEDSFQPISSNGNLALVNNTNPTLGPGPGPSPGPCSAVFHPLCAWFQGVYVDTIVTDPTFQGVDRIGRYPSGLQSRFLCEEHGPKGTAAVSSREEQMTLRRKYKINEDDLDCVPGTMIDCLNNIPFPSYLLLLISLPSHMFFPSYFLLPIPSSLHFCTPVPIVHTIHPLILLPTTSFCPYVPGKNRHRRKKKRPTPARGESSTGGRSFANNNKGTYIHTPFYPLILPTPTSPLLRPFFFPFSPLLSSSSPNNQP